MKRRVFLKFLAYLGLAGPMALSLGCGNDGNRAINSDVNNDIQGVDQDKVVAYKLSSRKRKSCNACKQHALNKMFLTQADANANRAHTGCNCQIKPVRVPADLHGRYFVNGPVYDRRSQA